MAKDFRTVEGKSSPASPLSQSVESSEPAAGFGYGETKVRSILDAALDCIIVTDETGSILEWNHAAEHIFGYPRGNVIGKEISACIIPPEMRAQHQLGIEDFLATGESKTVGKRTEIAAMRSDGSVFPAEISIAWGRSLESPFFLFFLRDISAQRDTDIARRESEERFRIIFEDAGIGVAVVGPDTIPILTNPALSAMLGYTQSEFQKMSFTEFTHPDDVDIDVGLYRELLSGKRNRYQIEKRYICKSGEILWARLIVSLARDAGRKPMFAIGMVEDISAQKRAVEELEKSELRYRTLLEASTQVIWKTDVTGESVDSPGWCALTGQSPEELLHEGWQNAIHPDDRPWVAETWRKAVAERRAYEAEFRLRLRDGSYRRFWARGVPIMNSAGGIAERVGSCTDIENQKLAEEALTREREFLRTVLDNIGEGIVAIDTSGRFTIVNRNARDLKIGGEEVHSIDEWFARYTAFYPDQKTPLRKEELPLVRALAGERVRNFELIIKNENGDMRSFVANSEPILAGDKTPVGAVVALHDVTEERLLREQFYQSQKMEAIGQLAGGVAHDFNNLLTVINGCADLLLRRLDKEDRLRPLATQIRGAGERSSALTQQLLAFSRKQVISPQLLDLNSVITESETMLKRLIGEDIEFSTELEPGAGNVLMDQSFLDQVLMNLVVNSRDAMPQGGKLTIRTRRLSIGMSASGSEKPESHPMVVLEVSDTGTGMSEEVKRHIFEPFFTTKGVKKGSGLGLATVYGIVKQAGGRIELQSELDEGTTFRLIFPVVESVEKLPGSLPERLAVPSGSETVLLVEDEEGVRSFVQEVLKECGYTVLTAPDGVAALTLAREYPASIQLLITDVVMPGKGGREVSESMRAMRPELKVLYVSGYTDDAVVRHGIMHHDVNFLQKPFQVTDLARKVREVLDSGNATG